MKQGSTLFLRAAVILMGVPVLALGIVGAGWLPDHPVSPEYSRILYPIIIGMYISVIPFFVVLYQAFRLLNFIDQNKAFSHFSVNALKKIKFSALIICLIYAAVIPFFYLAAQLDDAPGLIIVGMIPGFASMVIAVFAAVLQRLLKEAIDLKEENDLIV